MSPKARPPVEPAVPTYRQSGLKARVPVDPGPQGSQGVIGPVGPAGLGLPGVDGEDGVDGWMGPRGLTGATGAGIVFGLAQDGEDGEIGFPGASVAGAAGAAGSVSGCAFHNTTQALVTATFTALNFNSEDFQTGTLHSTVTNNSRVTIATAGVYCFTGTVAFAANATGQRVIVIKVNGTTYYDKLAFPNNGAGNTFEAQITKLLSLAAGDYVELFAYQDSGGNLNVGDVTFRYVQTALSWFRVA